LSKIILQGHIIVPKDELPHVQAALPKHIELTQQETGCLVFKVTQDLENNEQFNVYEEFSDRKSFESHQDRVKSSNWGQVTARVERHYTITESP